MVVLVRYNTYVFVERSGNNPDCFYLGGSPAGGRTVE